MGYEPNTIDQYKNEVVNVINHEGKLSYYQRHYALEEAYDLQYGLYLGYDDPNIIRPFAVIAFHDSEDTINGMMLERWLRRFIDLRVNSEIGMSFSEFIQLDVASALSILDVLDELKQLKDKALERQNRETEESIQSIGR